MKEGTLQNISKNEYIAWPDLKHSGRCINEGRF